LGRAMVRGRILDLHSAPLLLSNPRATFYGLCFCGWVPVDQQKHRCRFTPPAHLRFSQGSASTPMQMPFMIMPQTVAAPGTGIHA
jgi:hypothetical protein